MNALLNILRLLPILLVAACANQKTTVVEEPKKKPDTAKVEPVPVPLAPGADEELRDPSDLLDTLPEKKEFQATNPKAPAGKSEGAPVIAHPPSDPTAPGR